MLSYKHYSSVAIAEADPNYCTQRHKEVVFERALVDAFTGKPVRAHTNELPCVHAFSSADKQSPHHYTQLRSMKDPERGGDEQNPQAT